MTVASSSGSSHCGESLVGPAIRHPARLHRSLCKTRRVMCYQGRPCGPAAEDKCGPEWRRSVKACADHRTNVKRLKYDQQKPEDCEEEESRHL